MGRGVMPLHGSPPHAWGQGGLQYMNMLHKWTNKETRKKGGGGEKNRKQKKQETQWDHDELAEPVTSPRFIIPKSNSGPLGRSPEHGAY